MLLLGLHHLMLLGETSLSSPRVDSHVHLLGIYHLCATWVEHVWMDGWQVICPSIRPTNDLTTYSCIRVVEVRVEHGWMDGWQVFSCSGPFRDAL